MKKYYPLIRTLHLYTGLFISPFVLVFGISVLVFNHPALLNKISPVKHLPVIKTKLDEIPSHGSDLDIAKSVITKLGIDGEIDFISRDANSISFPVIKPRSRTNIYINTTSDSAFISRQQEGMFRSMSYLHSMPGPHNATIRGNSGFMKAWRMLTDTIVYLIFFLTASGVFLWYMLKTERVPGIYVAASGILFFVGLLLMIFK